MEGLCQKVSSRYELSWSFRYFNNLELDQGRTRRQQWKLGTYDCSRFYYLEIFINIHYLVVKLEF